MTVMEAAVLDERVLDLTDEVPEEEIGNGDDELESEDDLGADEVDEEDLGDESSPAS